MKEKERTGGAALSIHERGHCGKNKREKKKVERRKKKKRQSLRLLSKKKNREEKTRPYPYSPFT